MSALFLYWAAVLIVVTEVRRELGIRRDRRLPRGRALTVVLYGAVIVAVAGAVVLTALRLTGSA